MNDLVTFVFDDRPLRTVRIGAEAWFVAKDVALCLGYGNARQAIIDHCKHARSWSELRVKRGGSAPLDEGRGRETRPLPSREEAEPIASHTSSFDVRASLGLAAERDQSTHNDDAGTYPAYPQDEPALLLNPQPHTAMIPQGDLLRLVVKSRLPAAERFERLVFDVILPQILATGRWGPPPAPAAPDPDTTATALALIREIRLTHGIRAARAMWTDVGLPAVPDVFEGSHEDARPDRLGDPNPFLETVREFLDECCVEDRLGRVQASELYRAYCMWATARKGEIMSNTRFGMLALRAKLKRVDGAVRMYYGVRLRAEVLRQFEPKPPIS